MKRLNGAVLVEPGGLALLAVAAAERAARAVTPSEMAGATILRSLSETLTEFVAIPSPPIYIIAPASRSTVRKLARWLTN